MRQADDRDVANLGVLEQCCLDFCAIDVFAAANDDVLLAVDDEVAAVCVAIAKIAGTKPAAAERLAGSLFILPIARNHIRTPDPDLADFAIGAVAALVDDARIARDNRTTDAVRLLEILLSGVGDDGTGRLGQPVAVAGCHTRLKTAADGPDEIRRDRRAARSNSKKRRHLLRGRFRALQHLSYDIGHAAYAVQPVT